MCAVTYCTCYHCVVHELQWEITHRFIPQYTVLAVPGRKGILFCDRAQMWYVVASDSVVAAFTQCIRAPPSTEVLRYMYHRKDAIEVMFIFYRGLHTPTCSNSWPKLSIATMESNRSRPTFMWDIDLLYRLFLAVSLPPWQDNPDLFAIMEKTRMYIFRGLDPEVSASHPPLERSYHGTFLCSVNCVPCLQAFLECLYMLFSFVGASCEFQPHLSV